jgi:hypothetical protein
MMLVKQSVGGFKEPPFTHKIKLLHSYETTTKSGSIKDPIFYSTKDCKSLILFRLIN